MSLRALRKKYPLHPNMPSMRCVGYRQAWEYLEGEISEAELLEKASSPRASWPNASSPGCARCRTTSNWIASRRTL